LSALTSPLLSHEPTALHIEALPTLNKTKA
jgi:hypothetical protein